MKKLTFLALAICLYCTGCKKSETITPATTTPTTTPTTPKIDGTWTVKEYDGAPVTSPMASTIKFTASTSTTGTGTVHFDITFDGSTHKTEDDTYTLSSSDTKLDFAKTGGDYNVLGGGNTWTVDTLNSNTLRMTSKYNLIIKATK
jgi:hypothetical protein